MKLPMPLEIAYTVFGNLVENSRQHGATKVAFTSDNGRQITVQDNGAGISSANAKNLFTPFFTTKREHGGTGLGLVIIRSLLHAHHAEIQNSTAEKGACFVLSFNEAIS